MVRSLFRRKLGLRENRSSGDKKANGFRLPSEEEWELARRGGDPAKKDFSYSFNGAGTPGFGFRIARNTK